MRLLVDNLDFIMTSRQLQLLKKCKEKNQLILNIFLRSKSNLNQLQRIKQILKNMLVFLYVINIKHYGVSLNIS